MDTLPFPPRPNLEQYRKRAKDLVKASKSHDLAAVHAWATTWIESLARALEVPESPPLQAMMDRAVESLERHIREEFASKNRDVTLADAQRLIARAHSFDSWSDFATHADLANYPQDSVFENAVNAVITGDLATLDALLRANPELIHTRSARVHRVTLLHYVAANGVEDWRQKTPPNAVAIATRLLDAGAEVDALAETYGGGNAQTTMNLLVSSVHPHAAGLQSALVDVLLDYGAAVDGLDHDGSPLMTSLAFGYIEPAETLARRGARIDNVVAAASLGDAELVERFVNDGVGIAPSLENLYWIHIPKDTKSRAEFALAWACAYGRTEAATLLLEHGVSPASADNSAMTALHWAAGHGYMELVDLLLKCAAPLEARNAWGGTVLSSTIWFARQSPMKGADYPAVVQRLVAAGADVSQVHHPTGDARIDEALRG